jgi:8-oxo-dGTP diphosphatase
MKIVTAAIIRRGDKILLARRGVGSKLFGKWEFPGGKVDGTESLRDCLRRELDEELGVRVCVGEHLCSSEFVYNHGEFRIEAFWVEILAGELTPKVHDRIEWVTPSELRQYDLLPADVPIAEAVAIHFAR